MGLTSPIHTSQKNLRYVLQGGGTVVQREAAWPGGPRAAALPWLLLGSIGSQPSSAKSGCPGPLPSLCWLEAVLALCSEGGGILRR